MTLEDIYLENYPIVYGYLLSLCADPHEAEELTAQTFFKAIQSIHRYDGKYKPSTWLCTIGRNLFLNELKQKNAMFPWMIRNRPKGIWKRITYKRHWQGRRCKTPQHWILHIGRCSFCGWRDSTSVRSAQ